MPVAIASTRWGPLRGLGIEHEISIPASTVPLDRVAPLQRGNPARRVARYRLGSAGPVDRPLETTQGTSTDRCAPIPSLPGAEEPLSKQRPQPPEPDRGPAPGPLRRAGHGPALSRASLHGRRSPNLVLRSRAPKGPWTFPAWSPADGPRVPRGPAGSAPRASQDYPAGAVRRCGAGPWTAGIEISCSRPSPRSGLQRVETISDRQSRLSSATF